MKMKYKFLFVALFGILFFATNPFSVFADTFILIPKTDTKTEELQKAREKLNKENEDGYKQLQQDLKSVNSKIDSSLKSGVLCTYPVASCTESTYQRIKGNAISGGLAPDSGELASCRAKIDEYNQKLKDYEQCQQDNINQKINSISETEYKTELLKTKSDLQSKLDKHFYCAKTYGPNSLYDFSRGGCTCLGDTIFDSKASTCVYSKPKDPEADYKESPYGRYADLVPKNNRYLSGIKKDSTDTTVKKDVPAIIENRSNPDLDVKKDVVSVQQKNGFFQKLKSKLSKVRLWKYEK